MEHKQSTVIICLLLMTDIMGTIGEYDFKCPENIGRKLRAQSKCNNTEKYFCLYNSVDKNYEEGCEGSKLYIKGTKSIYTGDFSRVSCEEDRFQPFKFSTSEASECMFGKSLCSEFGQLYSAKGSSEEDVTCRCDTANEFGFITNTSHTRCFPAQADCSCFRLKYGKRRIIAGNSFVTAKTMRPVLRHAKYKFEWSSTLDGGPTILNLGDEELKADEFSVFRTQDGIECRKVGALIVSVLAGALIVSVLAVVLIASFVAVLLFKDRQYSGVTVDYIIKDVIGQHGVLPKIETAHVQDFQELFKMKKEEIFTKEEQNFLLLVYLVFCIACPLVRSKFNAELDKDYLVSQLKRNERQLKPILSIISCPEQNNLLWPSEKDDTPPTISSRSFDIRLMIILLQKLSNLNIPDCPPEDTDRSPGAMLARIKFTRNAVTLAIDGKLTDEDFEHHCKNTFQASYKLLSPNFEEIEKNPVLVCRLEKHLKLDNEQFRGFDHPIIIIIGNILRRIIMEYCESKQTSLSKLIDNARHELCHKRMNQLQCCECNDNSYQREISEVHWRELYVEDKNKSCACDGLNKCSRGFQAKSNLDIARFDPSLLTCLLLNVPCLLRYAFYRLYESNFKNILNTHKHQIYHAYKNSVCCMCQNIHLDGTICLTIRDWTFLFKERRSLKSFSVCKNKYCCCKYEPNDCISIDSLDHDMLYKLMRIIEPFYVLTGRVVVDDFLKIRYHRKTVKSTILHILNAVQKQEFKEEIKQEVQNYFDGPKKKTAIMCWVNDHIISRDDKEKGLVAIYNKLYNKNNEIKNDHEDDERQTNCGCLRISRLSEFGPLTNLTSEENYFVLLFYIIQRIVCSAVRAEFDRICTPEMMKSVLKDIKDEHEDNFTRVKNAKVPEQPENKQGKHYEKDYTLMSNRANTRPLYLSEIHIDRLFPTEKTELSKKLDLKLMILILERAIEKLEREPARDTKRDSAIPLAVTREQLKMINSIRSRVTQNSSGTVSEKEFKAIFNKLHMLRKLSKD